METNPTEKPKDKTCRNCLHLVHPANYPAALHRVFDCSKFNWNDKIRGINPSNPNGVRTPDLDYSCNEFKPDIRNHSIPDKEKINTENESRRIQRDEWESSEDSDDYTKRLRRRTQRKHSIEHLCGEPSFAQDNTSDSDSGDSSSTSLEELECLIPSDSICFGVFEDETWNMGAWRTEIHFYLIKSDDPKFLWELCGIHWDDNWSKYNWQLYSRITNIKNPHMAGFLLVEDLFVSWDKDIEENPHRDFLTSIINNS